ncbi:MAG: immunoglobulin domain-containing protein [Verrucomicrobiales bacterium]|nr:immunoglobulin domain-containing protein [Verrucomicrobiales bacterium]
MKRPLPCACFLLVAVIAWLAASTKVGAADCVSVTPPIRIGSYGSACFDASGFLVAGQLPGGNPCEYRGFLVFNVPPSELPYVSAELRVSIHSATAPSGGESIELRPVVTPLDLLINLSGDRAQTFSDLADGELLGSRDFVAQPPSFDGLGADLQVAIPLTEAGLAWINAARGRSVAVGVSVPVKVGATDVLGGVRFMDSLNRHGLVLNRSDAQAPQVFSLETGTRVHAGGTKSLSVVACGRAPLTTQWYKDGVALPGETQGILSFNPALPAQAGKYEFRASNDLGMASTSTIDLEVVPLTLLSELAGFTAPDGMFGYCLSVVASSSSLASYTWLRDGEVYKIGSVPFLCFEPISLKDSGSYQIVASNKYGSVTSRVAQVTVNPVPPVLEGYPIGTTRFAAGFSGELYSLAKGSEPIRYQWLKDSAPIAGATSNRLRFPAATSLDSGTYQVVAANSFGAVTSQLAQVEVVPALFNGPVHVSGSEGGRALLWAQPTAIPETAFQWYREGVKVVGGEDAFLLFPSLTSGDTGAYFLVASNTYGSATSVVARVLLETYPLNVSISASDPLPAVLGDDLVLGALISGAPQPRFQWYRNGSPITGATNATLVFPNVSPDDSALYTVEAANSLHSALSAGLQLDVVAQAPQFVVVPVDTTEVAGSVVTLHSRAVGGPLPTYQWRRSGVDLPGETNSTLVLQRAQAEDAGNYEIVARNTAGEARYSFSLSLRDATRLDRWDWNLPRPQGSRLLDIAWGDGRFVAVGRSGNVVTSVDGVRWDRSIIEADCDLGAVAYGQGRFVTVGTTRAVTGYPFPGGGTSVSSFFSGIILTSTDGESWTSVPCPSSFPVDIAFGNGVFVLTGSPEGVTPAFNYTSIDGIHWTPQYNGWTRSDRVNFVNGEFWASDQGYLYRSANGAQWRPAMRSLLGEPTGFVAFGNSQYVALGGYGQFGQISADGDQWLPFMSTYQGIQSLVFGNGRFVAAVYHDDENPSNFYPPAGTVITAEDGRQWTARDTGTRQELESVIFAEGRFWAVGEAGTISSSSNGIDWSPSLTANTVDYYGLTQHGDTVVVAGDDGAILTSLDGQTWTRQVTSSGRNLHTVHSAAGLVVAGGRGGRIMTSPDAVRWSNRNSETTNYVQRLSWADRWVAVCEGGDILTSLNGIAWSAVRTDPPSDHEGVAYGAGYWLVAGGYFRNGGTGPAVSTFFYSTDAIHWEYLSLDVGVRMRDVAFGDGRFVAVGNDGQVVVLVPTGDPSRPFSHTGAFTAPHLVPLGSQSVNLRRVRFSESGFLVVGNDGVMVSFTGVTEDWMHHRSRTSQNLHDVLAAADGSFYTVGNNGMILRSGVPEPYFTSILTTPQGVRLVFESAPSAGPLRLEESADMVRWTVLADPATSPVDLPSVSLGARYFRLVTR